MSSLTKLPGYSIRLWLESEVPTELCVNEGEEPLPECGGARKTKEALGEEIEKTSGQDTGFALGNGVLGRVCVPGTGRGWVMRLWVWGQGAPLKLQWNEVTAVGVKVDLLKMLSVWPKRWAVDQEEATQR